MKKTYWYKNSVVYQIYPRSFMDSNNDGIGDIKGIISKLDYLKELGVKAIWLSPIYCSPQADNGYDISDYRNIAPEYGTMEDFDVMLKGMHERGIKLIMDLVTNHTSDEHEWFKEALKDKNSPYRDYYFFRKGKKEGKLPPNNWTSFFGGSAWEKVDDEYYYLHLFNKKQPDLNWDNPKVRQEIKDIMKFWLDKGVDGFREDVITLISKRPGFKSSINPIPVIRGKHNFIFGPHLHEYLKEVYNDVLDHYDCMTVGETTLSGIKDGIHLVDEKEKELTQIFNFSHTDVDNYLGVKYFMRNFSLRRFKRRLSRWQYHINPIGWNTLFIENHDQRRSSGRFGTLDNGPLKEVGAKMLGTTYMLLKGTAYVYEGQEIGMTNGDFESVDDLVDVEVKTISEVVKKLHFPKKYVEKMFRNCSRDNSRTPMQWDKSEYGGFSKAKPWLKVNKNKDYINVEDQLKDKNSQLNYYKKLINLKQTDEVIINGDYKLLNRFSNKVFAYVRSLNKEKIIVISNFSSKSVVYKIKDELINGLEKILLSNYPLDKIDKKILLRPYETIVYKIKN